MSSEYCDRIKRRDFLRIGTIGGLSLAEVLRLQHLCANETKKQKDINCIFLFNIGGMPHQDMWDMKLDAPEGIRSDFQPIKTAVPGTHISNLLPKIATVTDKFTILRSMKHTDADHGRGYHIMMTGKKAGAGDFNSDHNNNQHPCLGSMIARMASPGALPPYISVPNFLNSGGPSWLGPSFGPFVIDADPAAPEFSVRDISLPASLTTKRAKLRQAALREINKFERNVEKVSRQEKSLDEFYQKAYSLMTSKKAKEAFDIGQESDKMRSNYGITGVGQCCLLARRLVEAGCRFVAVENGHWDTHRKNTWSLREVLCPPFDQAFPALLNDLSDRGLLERTLVVVITEFGRTPKINGLLGRDHWPNAFSILMAGAGLKVGQTIGKTDKLGAEVEDRPISPQDLAATILDVMGITNYEKIMYTPLGRPVKLIDGGKPVKELI